MQEPFGLELEEPEELDEPEELEEGVEGVYTGVGCDVSDERGRVCMNVFAKADNAAGTMTEVASGVSSDDDAATSPPPTAGRASR
ncbi:MAG: hypothetical protein ACKV2T_24630 [Kofleriaceae bacterium]